MTTVSFYRVTQGSYFPLEANVKLYILISIYYFITDGYWTIADDFTDNTDHYYYDYSNEKEKYLTSVDPTDRWPHEVPWEYKTQSGEWESDLEITVTGNEVTI